jgi:hypothetical protein
MGYFDNYFEGGSLDKDYNIIQGDLGAPMVLCHVAAQYLGNDAKLRRIFPGDRIEVMDTRLIGDARPGPRLQIYAATDETERRPTNLNVGDIEVFFAVRFLYEQVLKIPHMKAGLSDVSYHIRSLLAANHQLKVISNGCEISLSRKSHAGSINHVFEPVDDRGRIVATHEISWIYDVRLDEDTGRFEQIFTAGGT